MHPLIHNNQDASDETLAKEAEEFLKKSATLQAMAAIIKQLRSILLEAAEENPERQLGWLTLAEYRKAFPASMRMQALSSRPDIRQRITTELTGLRANAARSKDPEFQAGLIDATIDSGDIQLVEFEKAFNPDDLVVYMDTSLFWQYFMNESLARMIEENTAREKDFFAFLLGIFLLTRNPLKPILTHLDVRRAIEGSVWQQRIPLELRVKVDAARLEQESKTTSRAFTAKQEIEIVTLEVIVESLDLSDLVPILQAAGKAMGFETTEKETEADELFDIADLEDSNEEGSEPAASDAEQDSDKESNESEDEGDDELAEDEADSKKA